MSAKGLQITNRDIHLFLALQKFKYLDIQRIQKFVFDNVTISTVNARLNKLLKSKLIYRIHPPTQRSYFYYIKENIRDYIQNDFTILKQNQSHLIHDIENSKMCFHLNQEYLNRSTVYSESELSYLCSKSFPVVCSFKNKDYKISTIFLPDFSILYEEKGLYFFEYDRSTEFGHKLHSKVFSYLEYFKSQDFKEDFLVSLNKFRICFLCLDEKRINAIMKLYQGDDILKFLVFTTHEKFIQNNKPLHQNIWRHVDKEGLFPLIVS